MRTARILVLSAFWAALFGWAWLIDIPPTLAITCLVAAPLVAYLSASWWPMLVPVGLLAALVGTAVIAPTNPVECNCEPVRENILLMVGVPVVAVLGVAYAVGWQARQAVDERVERKQRRLR